MKEFSPRRTSYADWYRFMILVSAEFMMSFTFLGYVHIEPISITFAYLPILFAGCFLGVGQAVFMGLCFGLASMFKASSYYVMPSDQIFSPFFSGAPLESLLLSLGARMLFGCLVGLLFLGAKRTRHARVWAGAISLIAPKLHSILVYAAMQMLFPDLGYTVANAFRLNLSDILLALLCLLLVEGAWSLHQSKKLRSFSDYLNRAHRAGPQKHKLHWAWVLFLLCILGVVVATTVYFAQRMTYMLGVHGLALSPEAEHDLLHLQIQSLFATLSLCFLLAVCLLIVYHYLSYLEYMGQMDAVTGVMGRKMFLHYCEDALDSKDAIPPRQGCFLFVDVDYFKSINDTLGHPVGDAVLREVAQALQSAFSAFGGVGRMGGEVRRVADGRHHGRRIAPKAGCLSKRHRCHSARAGKSVLQHWRLLVHPPAGHSDDLSANRPAALCRQAPGPRLLCDGRLAKWASARHRAGRGFELSCF